MSNFPKFWDILEEEMDVNAVDLVEIKSIFCALGFMTKTSVASIKTLKKLISLEAEYIKMRSNVNAFQAVCNKFPALESIESFSSGIIATMNDVIAHLNPKKSQAIPITLDEEGRKSMAEATQKAIVKQAKQVCDKITDENVIFEQSGTICKIQCPECDTIKKLSSYVNNDTGKSTFSVYNFSRHYSSHSNREPDDTNGSPNPEIDASGESSKQTQIERLERELNDLKKDNDNKNQEITNLKQQATGFVEFERGESSKQTQIERLERELNDLKKDNDNKDKEITNLKQKVMSLEKENAEYTDEHQRIIADKDKVISKAIVKLAELRENHAVLKVELDEMRKNGESRNSAENDKSTVPKAKPQLQKTVQQLKFKVDLCCFEKITASGIKINANEVEFQDCTGADVHLNFNKIHHGYDDKFESVKPIMDSFINGGISCVINYGTTKSGKTSTMFGADGDSFGLLGQSGEYILKSIPFKVSAFEILDNVIFDLFENRVPFDEEHSKLEEKLISSYDEFKKLVKQINESRTQKPTNQNPKSSRSHLFVILQIENSASKMAFVDLAGFESSEGKNVEESKHINTSLSELNMLLISAKKNQPIIAKRSNKMTTNLKPFLSPPSETIILCHINNDAAKKGFEYMKDFVTSRKALKRHSAGALTDISNAKITR